MAPRASSSRASASASATSPDLGLNDGAFSEAGNSTSASINGGGAPSRRRPVNREKPQPSYAYGAPLDEDSLRRMRERERRASAGLSKSGSNGDVSTTANNANTEATATANDQPAHYESAQQRYAKLKRRAEEAAAASAAASPVRRSARRSAAGSQEGSQAGGANNMMSPLAARKKRIDAIEEDEGVNSEDEAAERAAAFRHSQARAAAAAAAAANNTTATTSTNTTNGGQQQLYSFYLRAGASRSSSVARDEDEDANSEAIAENNNNVLGSTLLRGAQRPSHDPLSPRRATSEVANINISADLSARSSSDGESRASFTDAAAHAERLQLLQMQQQESTPRRGGRFAAQILGVMGQISPWGSSTRGTTSGPLEQSKEVNGHDTTAEAAEEEADDSAATRRKVSNTRKARTSKDNAPFRPSAGDASSSEEEESDEGRKHSGRRNKRYADGSGTSAIRAGREDNKIWMAGKRKVSGGKRARKAKRTSGAGADEEMEMGDSTLEALQEEMEEEKSEAEEEIQQAENQRVKRRRQTKAGKWLPTIPSIPTMLRNFGVPLLAAGLAATAAYNAGLNTGSLNGLASTGAFSAPNVPISNYAALVSRLNALEGKVSQVSRVVDSETRASQAQASRLARVEEHSAAASKRVSSLEAHSKRTDAQIAQLAAQAAHAQNVADGARRALEALQDELPARFPVRMDKKGELHIEASFWEALGKVFASKTDGASDAQAQASSWRDFLAANEASLRALAREEAAGAVSTGLEARLGKGVVLERTEFLQLLNAEIESLKTRLETRFHENSEAMSAEILGKVRQQREMFEASGSWSASKQQQAEAPAPSQAAWMNKLLSKPGQALKDDLDRSAVLELIDAALEAYSADRVNRADFALFSAGARVVPSLTSPTYEVPAVRTGLVNKLVGRSAPKIPGRPAAMALHPDTAPGMCWPFKGDDGQLGVRLARKVVPTDITLEHAPRTLTFGDASSAPREVAVWATVERAEDRQRLLQYRARERQARALAIFEARTEEEDEEWTPAVLPPPPSPNHVLVASFTYDVSAGARAVQTFPVSAEARALRIPIQTTQIRFLNNHGHPDFTCVYRVRVHGEEWTE